MTIIQTSLKGVLLCDRLRALPGRGFLVCHYRAAHQRRRGRHTASDQLILVKMLVIVTTSGALIWFYICRARQ